MAESRVAKSSKKKSGEKDREHSREQIQQPTFSSPHADILKLQQTVGNQGVIQLLRSGRDISSSTGEVLQRKCACGNAASLIGQCAECNNKQLAYLFQPKLVVGAPNDKYEQEADRVSEQAIHSKSTSPETHMKYGHFKPQIDGLSQSIDDQKSFHFNAPPQVTRAIAVKSGGNTLRPELKEKLATLGKKGLNHIQVYKNANTEKAAASIGAKAFTFKNSIYLGANYNQNDTRLMAHEALHVLQYEKNGKAIIRRTPNPRSLRQTLVVPSLSPAEIQTEINLINEWIRNNPRNSANESTHLILEAALERLRRPISPPQRRRSSGPVRATSRTIRNIGSSSEPEVARGSVRIPAPRVPQGTEGRSAERAAERAAQTPESFEHTRRAFSTSEAEIRPGVRVRSRPTVSSGQVQLQVPIERVSPQRVQELARQMGFQMPEHLARHAEVQQATSNPNRPVGVSRPQCGSCFAFFVRLARHRGRTQVVNDTVATRYFHPNGEVIEIWNDGTRVRLEMSPNGHRVLSATSVPPQAGGSSTPSGSSAAVRRTSNRASRVPAAIPQAARTPAQGPASRGPSRFGAGISAAGGGMALIMIANEILGPVGRILNLQRRNIQMGLARIEFWRNFTNETPTWAVWDQSNQVSLAQTSELTTGIFSGATYPYIVDINVEALRRVLPTKIGNFNDFALFLDMAKSIQAISEQPVMPALPTAAERRVNRNYYVTVNGPTSMRRRYNITEIIDSVRQQAVEATNRAERSRIANLPTNERSNIFRLRSGNQTNIFRSAHGRQNIRSSRQLFGSDPWVRPLGRRFEGGVWSWFRRGHYSDRVLVEPANGDARQGVSPAVYQIYQTIEATRDEVRTAGRQILDEQESNAQLQSFVGGPSRGQERRFGMIRYYRHPSNPSWTVAIGELNQFWVDASDLEPVSRSAVERYIGQIGSI